MSQLTRKYMSVRKRGDKWWVDFCFSRLRYRRPSPDNSRAGAQAFETLLRYKLARGEPIEEEEPAVNFKEFADSWFQTYVRNNNKHSEIIGKETILRVHLIPYFGRLKLESIGNLIIEKYKAHKIKEGLNPKTVNNHLTVLNKALRCAFEWGAIKKCPIIKPLKFPPQKYDFLTVEECEQLINSADGIWREMIITVLGTGLRFGELIALLWDDIDFTKGELTVRQAFAKGVLGSPKSNKIRRIPMTESVCEVLKNKRKGKCF